MQNGPKITEPCVISTLVGVTWLITWWMGGGGGNRPCLYYASRRTQVFHIFCLSATQMIV